MNVLINYKERIVDGLVLIAIAAFLISFFEPQYLLSKTITTGGDTASHYYTAQYLKENLLPHGKIIGWMQGNYGGFPLFQFYFPFPFVIMVVLSLIMPLQIAFKIVTVLGTFLLPLFAYLSLRGLKYDFPIPVFGALSTLPFLFMEDNSMWGGNIPSTLAGEFAYSLGFTLVIVFIGSLYDGILSGKGVIRNAVLVALIGYSHGYALLYAGVVSLFFIITTMNFTAKLKYLFKIHILGFMLMGIWIIPLLYHLPYTTRYSHVWYLASIFEVFPVVLLPLIAVAVLGRVAAAALFSKNAVKKWRAAPIVPAENRDRPSEESDTRIYYLWFCVIVAGLFYLIANRIHVVDIRFFPFMQVFLMIIAAVEMGRAVRVLRVQWLFPIILAIPTFIWVDQHTVNIRSWISWNYEGFENKPQWPAFSSLNHFIAGSVSDPRVVYEHNEAHNDMGTVRAFESLPLFSGRSTLEGLYMQSSITTPFVFYIQSEISKEISCPLSDYGCATLNLKNGIQHLKMFNVKHFIVRSNEVRSEIQKYPEFILKKKFGPLDLYELSTNENRYVMPLRYEPVLFETMNWKIDSYRWFENHSLSDIHLVFKDKIGEADAKRFKAVVRDGNLNRLPRIPIDASCKADEKIEEEAVFIKTNCIHKPLLIKISYHPNWRVEGADQVYLASPSFMLIFPEREEVVLRFSMAKAEYAGLFLSMAGLFMIVLSFPGLGENRVKRGLGRLADAGEAAIGDVLARSVLYTKLFRFVDANRTKVLIVTLVALASLFSVFVLSFKKTDPHLLYSEGFRYFNENKFAEARDKFEAVIKAYPITGAANDASYYSAITYFKEGNYQKTIEQFQRLIANYPESNWVPEAYYHIGLSYAGMNQMDKSKESYLLIVNRYSTSDWSKHAGVRLIELSGKNVRAADPAYFYDRAMKYFDAGEYERAKGEFLDVSKKFPAKKLGESSRYFYAICFFKEEKYDDVIREFERFIHDYPNSDYVPEAYYHIGISYQRQNNDLKAKPAFEKVIRNYPDSRWAGYSKEALKSGKI